MTAPIQLAMGWDPREEDAFEVAADSAHAFGDVIHGMEIRLSDMLKYGYTSRSLVHNNPHNLWDVPSAAPCATEFAISRFLTGMVALRAGCRGWVIFTDCDVVWLASPSELLALADPKYAIMCVQHDNATDDYASSNVPKMDGQLQTFYARKNWSSVMLWNLDHPGNLRLTDHMLEWMPGRDLHRFCWLKDEELGALPAEWNWLVGPQPMPTCPKLAHFTLGGPWLPGWRGQEHDDIWLAAREAFRARR